MKKLRPPRPITAPAQAMEPPWVRRIAVPPEWGEFRVSGINFQVELEFLEPGTKIVRYRQAADAVVRIFPSDEPFEPILKWLKAHGLKPSE